MALITFLLVALVLGLIPWVFVGFVFGSRREIRELRERVNRLEREASDGATRPAPGTGQARIATAPAPTAPLAPETARTSAPRTPLAPPAPVAATTAPSPRDPNRLEAQVGGIWMQNVGSVLLLLGAFFLIVWGYANGRIGAGVLVLAGVLLGLVIAWRGNVIARSIAPLGNALIGVGFGVVYITLYLGHFRMHVLPGWAAFSSLVLVALATVAVGLRRREPIIATFGVVGAFLPQLLAAWIPLHGFRLALPALLAYFAVVNSVVFALAATVGWSGLAILSMVLTTGTWSANAAGSWSLGAQLGLSALFAALGLAPVVRLARSDKPIRAVDLAVVALAPMFLLLASMPFLAAPDRSRAAALLGGLGAVYAATSLWIGARRGERDLWKPLTAAAAVFLAAAIERGFRPEHLALAWSAEGAALVWLGLGRDGSWLRYLGYLILSVAGLRLLVALFSGVGVAAGNALLFGPTSLRDLLCIAVFLGLAHVLGRSRERLSPGERHVPAAAAIGANLLLAIWIGREAGQLRWFVPGLAKGLEGGALIAGAAWLLQSLVLLILAARRRAPALRHVGYAIAFVGTTTLLLAPTLADPWRPGDHPLLNAGALITALGAILLIAMAEVLWRVRARLGMGERRMPEVVAAVANLVLLFWWSRQSGHVAWTLEASPAGAAAPEVAARTLAAVLTSAAWTVQAMALFALGWLRESAFLRWSGLVLFGLTVLKFVAVDLDRVDTFWRFVSAIGIGAALLIVSFLYQRRSRRSGVELRGRAEVP